MKADLETFNAICRKDLESFICRAFRIIHPSDKLTYSWHIGCIAEHLTACWDLEVRRLIINMPPRLLKTFIVSTAFPAWGLGKDPTKKFLALSHKQDLTKTMTLNTRRIVDDGWYKSCFTNTRLSQEVARQDFFQTTKLGQYAASPVSSVTGTGAHIVIVDDPISAADAMSPTIRESVNKTLRNSVFSRFNKPTEGVIIIVQQRLHSEDTTGDFLKDGNWLNLKLPSEAKSMVQINLRGKQWTLKQGEVLAEGHLTKQFLDEIRTSMSENNYLAQYMQEPIPVGGMEFKEEWFANRFDQKTINVKEMNVAILCDPSSGEEVNKKKKKHTDYSAFMVVGKGKDQNYYLLDAVRDRLNPTERVETLFILHRKWAGLCGKQPKVGYERYGMMTDTHYIKLKQDQESYRFPLVELGGRHPKEERIRQLIPDMQNGRWWFPHELSYYAEDGQEIDLMKEIVYGEFLTFPNSQYDDMIDALARVYEADLNLLFPKQAKQNMIARERAPQSWEDF